MATINASTGADIIVPSNNGTTYRGLEGNDTYILSNAIAANAKVTIVDTAGTNAIQLVDGLSIASSKFAGDSVQLTLSNGAVVTVNNADKFTFEVGGNETSGVTGSSSTFAGLASAMGVSSLPTGSTITDGSAGTVSGSSLSTGSISYSLSASGTNVAEGSSLTYTITASASSDSDVTLTYNVIGDDNNASVEKATGSDLDTLSGTVTIAAGSTSATFDITPTADSLSEGLEGIMVTVFDATLEEAVTEKLDTISENVDKYLDYVVSEWMTENEIAIEAGIKVEMAESLLSGLKNLFVEHNVAVSEETVDVVESLEGQVSELEGKANDLVNENIDLQKEIASFKAVQKFDEISEGLSENQVERLRVLSEKLDVEDVAVYSDNLQVIKESFFSDKPLVEKHDVQAETDEIILEDQEVIKPTSDYTSINALVEAFDTRK